MSDLFENDYFKDAFDTRVEKHLEPILKQIEVLKKDNKRLEEHRVLNNTTMTKILNVWSERVKDNTKEIAELKEEKPSEPSNDKLYELYLEDGGQVYFRQLYHPFKQYNNMVHLGIGQVIAERNEKETLIAEFIQDIQDWLDCKYGYDDGLMRGYWIKTKEEWEAKLK